MRKCIRLLLAILVLVSVIGPLLGSKAILARTYGGASMDSHGVATTPVWFLRSIERREARIATQRRVRVNHTASLLAMRASADDEPEIAAVLAQPEINTEHQRAAQHIFQYMPKRCQDSLQNFYVRYDNPKNRGLGGASIIILSGNVPLDEYIALFVHEFGHVVDLGCLNGTSRGTPTAFADNKTIMRSDDPSVSFYSICWTAETVMRSRCSEQSFVSGYASWDVFEDFAESFAYYVLHRDAFTQRADENPILAEKLAWFEQNLPDVPALAHSTATFDGSVPWDITKLSYAWLPSTQLAMQ